MWGNWMAMYANFKSKSKVDLEDIYPREEKGKGYSKEEGEAKLQAAIKNVKNG